MPDGVTPTEVPNETPAATPVETPATDSPVQTTPNADTPQEQAASKTPDNQQDKPDEGKVGAPEAYADFTIPEGITVNDSAISSFKEVAKNLNLTQEQAQGLVDLQTKIMQEASTKQEETFNTLQDEWVDTAKADKEIGGEHFNENVAVANKALKAFGTPELNDVLDFTGAGNHPEVIRFFYRIGKAIGEDKLHVGSNPIRTEADFAKALYTKSNHV